MNSRHMVSAGYFLKEVSKKTNIPPETIKQWEKDGLLVVPRTKQGARYYTDTDISLLIKIKKKHEQNMKLEQHIKNDDAELLPESFEIKPQESPTELVSAPNVSIQPPHESASNNIELFYTTMTELKKNLLTEIKHELSRSKTDLIDEVKNEVTNSSLLTVKEISKSIQRSNDKQKAHIHEISNMIMKASEQTSETVEILSGDILKSSEAVYEKLSERIIENAKLTDRRNQRAMEKMSNSFQETQDNLAQMHSQQKAMIESLNELKQSQEEIQRREAIFQSMISGYREVASAKKKRKKWWKFWA